MITNLIIVIILSTATFITLKHSTSQHAYHSFNVFIHSGVCETVLQLMSTTKTINSYYMRNTVPSSPAPPLPKLKAKNKEKKINTQENE